MKTLREILDNDTVASDWAKKRVKAICKQMAKEIMVEEKKEWQETHMQTSLDRTTWNLFRDQLKKNIKQFLNG